MPGSRYTYKITAGISTFTATATADLDEDDTIDTWKIDETGTLTCTTNDAAS